MNTPAHLIFGAMAFARPGRPGVNTAALAGALLPDVSLYAMVGWAMMKGMPPRVIFGEYYFSPEWQSVFAVDNSFILWGLGLLVALALRSGPGVAFAGAGLLHLLFDLPLHNEDARMHFWPATQWVFRSPFSYWDPRHHGPIVGALEWGICLVFLIALWRRFRSVTGRGLVLLGGVMELAPGLMFALMFARG